MIKDKFNKETKIASTIYSLDILICIGTLFYVYTSNLDRLTVFFFFVVVLYIIFLCAYNVIISIMFDKNKHHM
jgi:amino acid permease